MKIGILTMNYAQNYGGVLQAYGLSQYLRGKEHTVEIINYRNTGKNSLFSILSKFERCLQNKKKQDNSSPIPKERLSETYLNNFKQFKSEKLHYTEPVNEISISAICKRFDVVIIGSDQIWNDVFTNKLIYYFDWSFKGKKIAYAACTVLDTTPIIRTSKIRKLLSSFDKVTVRDVHTQNYVSGLGLSKPDIVVDPSCLYDYHDCIKENPIGKPYILTYILSGEISGGNNKAIEIIKEYIGEIPVVSVCIPSVSTISKDISDYFLTEASPEEWVNLFYHASFVLTDSFHGIMFSMKFRKPFVAYMKDGNRKSRLQDLIDRFSLNNIVTNVEQIRGVIANGVIDYEQIGERLEPLVKESVRILNNAIND